MNLKIAFTDIDGTLLNKERVPSMALKKEVSKLQKKDIPFVLISSRMPRAMFHLQKSLEIQNTPLICFNGGLVLVDKKAIHSTEIPIERVEKIVNLNSENNFHISLYHRDEWFVEAMDFWAKREENNTKVRPQVAPLKKVLTSWKKQAKGAHKVMCMGPKDALDRLVDQLQETQANELHLYRSKDSYLEIAPREISKLTGIKILLKHQYQNLTLENCIAFGDNYNDLEMLSAVKMGVAVKNAKNEVLKVADDITDSHHNDGVAKSLRKHFSLTPA